MKSSAKIISAVLGLSFFVASNYCAVQCAFASEAREGAAQCHEGADHHQESKDRGQDPESGEHDAGSVCCSSLIAVKDPSASIFPTKSLKEPVLLTAAPQNTSFKSDVHSKDKPEFPPGALPPPVFLLTHLSHAPPLSF